MSAPYSLILILIFTTTYGNVAYRFSIGNVKNKIIKLAILNRTLVLVQGSETYYYFNNLPSIHRKTGDIKDINLFYSLNRIIIAIK